MLYLGGLCGWLVAVDGVGLHCGLWRGSRRLWLPRLHSFLPSLRGSFSARSLTSHEFPIYIGLFLVVFGLFDDASVPHARYGHLLHPLLHSHRRHRIAELLADRQYLGDDGI